MKIFKGTYTALVTPFENEKVDFESLRKLVENQLENGIDGFIVNGTTGESPTLTVDEVEALMKFVRSICGHKHQIILGVGTNCTSTTLEWITRANRWKADGALAVVPYYNKPPQRGLVKHFQKIADQSEVPVILYNVPGRTIQSLSVESIKELSQHKMIQGIKESTGDLKLLSEIIKVVPKDFSILSGDDGTSVEFCLKGGDGVIGVVTHVIPKEMSELILRARNKDQGAVKDFSKWTKLIESIYLEANPIPVKMALYLKELIRTPQLRLPLVELDSNLVERLKQCL